MCIYIFTVVSSIATALSNSFTCFIEASVGFEKAHYSVNEASGMVEICAVVNEPNVDCPIEFDFNMTFQTRDGSAGTYICTQVVHSYVLFTS